MIQILNFITIPNLSIKKSLEGLWLMTKKILFLTVEIKRKITSNQMM